MTTVEEAKLQESEEGGPRGNLRSLVHMMRNPSPVVKRYLRNPLSMAGTILVILFALVALGAPILAPPPENSRDPYQIPRDGYSAEPEPPSAEHIWGTTEGQYDIYYGVVWAPSLWLLCCNRGLASRCSRAWSR
jgi:ABC-type dipeptide/oligopeptide/nickel transport system permease subunit